MMHVMQCMYGRCAWMIRDGDVHEFELKAACEGLGQMRCGTTEEILLKIIFTFQPVVSPKKIF